MYSQEAMNKAQLMAMQKFQAEFTKHDGSKRQGTFMVASEQRHPADSPLLTVIDMAIADQDKAYRTIDTSTGDVHAVQA